MLKWIGLEGKSSWFPPDRMENFQHDAPEGSNMTVVDVNGLPICGRVVNGSNLEWVCQLRDWIWVP